MNYPKNILYFFGFALIVAPLFIVQPKTDTPSEVMLYISAVLGYIGLVFLLIMYGLGSKSVARLLSNDL